MPPLHRAIFTRSAVPLGIVVAGLGAVAFARSVLFPSASPLASAGSIPLDAIERDETWYWLERPAKGAAHLVRGSRGARMEVAAADDIRGFDVDSRQVVYAARTGAKWSIMIAGAGASPHEIWSGSEQPGRPILAGGRAVWTSAVPGLLRSAISLPTLEPTTRVLSAAEAGHAAIIAELPESSALAVGAHGNELFLESTRPGPPVSTVFYAVSLDGGAVRRIAAEEGSCSAVLRADGTLVWSAPSRESSSAHSAESVRALPPGAPAVTEGDWLPAPGTVGAGGASCYYVDQRFPPGLWVLHGQSQLPTSAALPRDLAPVAVGERTVLLRRRNEFAGPQHLYVMSRPQ